MSQSNRAKRLDGKVAIITGGASGIGATAVQLFAEHRARVVIADVQDQLGETLANDLGEDVTYIHCDVSKEDQVINVINTTVAKYGRLDIMYNNAGVMDKPRGSILDSTKSDLDRVLSVNLFGAFFGAKHAARVMVPQEKGCILFTASVCASIGGLATHPYAVSKHAIVGLMKNLAAELGVYGIRVNCVSPSGVVTNMTGSNRVLTPEQEGFLSKIGNLKGVMLKTEDVANAALYLASDEACYVSGLNLVVDGGLSIVNPSFVMPVRASS